MELAVDLQAGRLYIKIGSTQLFAKCLYSILNLETLNVHGYDSMQASIQLCMLCKFCIEHGKSEIGVLILRHDLVPWYDVSSWFPRRELLTRDEPSPAMVRTRQGSHALRRRSGAVTSSQMQQQIQNCELCI